MNQQSQALTEALQKRIRTFSRIEKAFYGSIIFTAIIMAVGIIYLQSRNLQVQQTITQLNSDIVTKKSDLNNAKQEVGELTQRDRIVEIAGKAGLTSNNATIGQVE